MSHRNENVLRNAYAAFSRRDLDEEGRLAEFREYPEDLYSFDAAWG
jgi:hypothetical protein